jgi:hypothetical protein
MTTFTCPVCGFTGMEIPPENHAICPCCGTHFAYDDVMHSYRELRNRWLKAGGHWFNIEVPHAFNDQRDWSAWKQLDAAGLPYDVPNPIEDLQQFNVKFSGPVITSSQISFELRQM